MQAVVRFAYDSMVLVIYKGRIFIQLKNGVMHIFLIYFFGPTIKSDLLHLRQLIEMGYGMRLDNKHIAIFDGRGNFILKVSLLKNHMFPVEIKNDLYHCLSDIVN